MIYDNYPTQPVCSLWKREFAMSFLRLHLGETKGESAEAKLSLVGVRGSNVVLGITAPQGNTVYIAEERGPMVAVIIAKNI